MARRRGAERDADQAHEEPSPLTHADPHAQIAHDVTAAHNRYLDLMRRLLDRPGDAAVLIALLALALACLLVRSAPVQDEPAVIAGERGMGP